MIKKRILSSVLSAALTFLCFGAVTSFAEAARPQAEAFYGSDFENGATDFTDFIKPNANATSGMSINYLSEKDKPYLKNSGNMICIIIHE